jgi:hypothetical protein
MHASDKHPLVIKPVTNNVVDVFRGIGWDNWSRFQKKGNHFELIGGAPLATHEYQELKNGMGR